MKIIPKREEDLSTGFEPLPDGEYPFTVLESGVQECKSAKNAGKSMCKVKLEVHGKDYSRYVFDCFADWFSEWKLKHFHETTGMARDYMTGEIVPENNSWQGRTGYVKLVKKPAQGSYPEGNEVRDYLPEDHQTVEAIEAAKLKPVVAQPTDATPDDVPF